MYEDYPKSKLSNIHTEEHGNWRDIFILSICTHSKNYMEIM